MSVDSTYNNTNNSVCIAKTNNNFIVKFDTAFEIECPHMVSCFVIKAKCYRVHTSMNSNNWYEDLYSSMNYAIKFCTKSNVLISHTFCGNQF